MNTSKHLEAVPFPALAAARLTGRRARGTHFWILFSVLSLLGLASPAAYAWNYPQYTQAWSLEIEDVRLGNAAIMKARGISLYSPFLVFQFFVQGPVAPYNDGMWHYVGNVLTAGNDSTVVFSSWNPPGEGDWFATFQPWDSQYRPNAGSEPSSNAITHFNVVSNSNPKVKGLRVADARSGNAVRFYSQVSDPGNDLMLIYYFVQGPGAGYNDGSWHNVGTQWVAGGNVASTCTFTPNAPGRWIVTAQAWDQQYNPNSDCITAFIVPPPGGLYGFRILVDTNCMTNDDMASPRLSELAADGVWTCNSQPSVNWPAALLTLNAGSWLVTEDNPSQSVEYQFMSNVFRVPDAAMVYQEIPGSATYHWGNDTTLTGAQLKDESTTHGRYLIPHTRTYEGAYTSNITSTNGDLRGYFSRAALNNGNASGIVLEANGGNGTVGIASCVADALNLGKKCYLLITPKPSWEGQTLDYPKEVMDTMHLINASSLANPNLYIVVSMYNHDFVGAFEGANSSNNSMLAAVNRLKAFRATGN